MISLNAEAMMQFVVIARDGNDAGASERRQAVRPVHLQGASALKQDGHFIIGGAILDESGNRFGSVMILQFEDQAQFDAGYAREPHIAGGVWKSIEVQRFRVADV